MKVEFGHRWREPFGFRPHLVNTRIEIVEREQTSIGAYRGPLHTGSGVSSDHSRVSHYCALGIRDIALQNGRPQLLGTGRNGDQNKI